ncbi:MAG TPA: SDR family oxidoreductase [Mycobacteriales bacterium]
MDLGLRGRVALVAGGTSGLGLAAAVQLAAEGADVSVCGRDPDRLAAAVSTVDGAGKGRVLGTVADVRSDAGVAGWVERTVAELGGPHVVLSNAGGPPPGPVESFTVADHRDALEVALLPHVRIVLAALPHLRAAGWGRVLLVASETVRQPIPAYGLSAEARLGLLGFARSLVASLGPAGITVNVLAPGYHRTPGLVGQWSDVEAGLAEVARDIPLGRVGRPEDFGAVVAFLASEQAGFVSGTVLLVDGGKTKGVG